MTKISDQQFVEKHAHEIFTTKIGGSERQGLKVDELIILGNDTGYLIYSLHNHLPLIERPFVSLQLAYGFAKSIVIHYKEFLPLLAEPEYAKRFFELTQHSVPHGQRAVRGINYLNDMPVITQTDLEFAFIK